MTLIEMKNKVHAVCNNHSCLDCPLFSICVNISKSKDETPREWEKRFYLTLHAKLQTIAEAKEIAAHWNECYKQNGTYLFTERSL